MKKLKLLRFVFLGLALMTSSSSVSADSCPASGGYIGSCNYEVTCYSDCYFYCMEQGGGCTYRDSSCQGPECHCACEIPPLNS